MLTIGFVDVWRLFNWFWQSVIAHQGIIIAVVTIIILLISYRVLTKQLGNFLTNRIVELPNRQQILSIWHQFWIVGGTVLIVVGLSGSLSSLGISLGFMVAALGIAMRVPVTGFIAWIMIQLIKPFKIGDRIIVGNINPMEGEVIDITLFHTVLKSIGEGPLLDNQEEKLIFIANATLFDQPIQCSELAEKIIKEISIVTTIDSDIEVTEQLIIYSLVIADTEKEIEQQFKILVELLDGGIKFKLRCLMPRNVAQDLASAVTIAIIENIQKAQQVKLKV